MFNESSLNGFSLVQKQKVLYGLLYSQLIIFLFLFSKIIYLYMLKKLFPFKNSNCSYFEGGVILYNKIFHKLMNIKRTFHLVVVFLLLMKI